MFKILRIYMSKDFLDNICTCEWFGIYWKGSNFSSYVFSYRTTLYIWVIYPIRDRLFLAYEPDTASQDGRCDHPARWCFQRLRILSHFRARQDRAMREWSSPSRAGSILWRDSAHHWWAPYRNSRGNRRYRAPGIPQGWLPCTPQTLCSSRRAQSRDTQKNERTCQSLENKQAKSHSIEWDFLNLAD